MTDLQAQLDLATNGQPLQLDPPGREFQGPIIIRKAIVLDGHGATVWAKKGPVISVLANGVVLNSINVEVTGNDANLDGEANCALAVAPGLGITFNQVSVRGNVRGLDSEEGDWSYPRSINFGQLKAKRPHRFKVKVNVPVPCTLISKIEGLSVEPKQLCGRRLEELTLSLDALSPVTLLRGELWLQTSLLTRLIKVNGSVRNIEGANVIFGDGQVVWEPHDVPVDTRAPHVEPEPLIKVPPELEDGPLAPTESAPITQSAVVSPPVIPATPSTQRITESVPIAPSPVIVSKLGDGNFTTIGEAIRSARLGTRIVVRPALYCESLILDKRLEIVGEGKIEDVIVESADASCLRMQTDFARVCGMTLRGVSGRGRKEQYAVDIPQGQLVLEDCIITSEGLACLAVHGSKAIPLLRRCRLHGSKSAGLLIFDRADGEFEDCAIFNNTLAGVEIKQGANPTLRRCQVYHGQQVGVLIHQMGQGKLESCEIYGNALAGVEIRGGGSPVLLRCKVRDGKSAGVLVHDFGRGSLEHCEIFGNSLAGVEVRQGSDPVLKRCTIHHGMQAGLLFGQDAHGSVEECDIFENACAGVEIRQSGTPVLRNKCKIRKGKQAGILVWQGGLGTVQDAEIVGNGGAGVAITDGGNPHLQRCQISENTLSGVVVWDNGGGTLEHCHITKNALAGIAILRKGNPTALHCNIHGNGDAGVWAHDQGTGRIEHCDLTGNARSSLDIEEGCTVTDKDNKTG
ncbi:MAG TPA: right-handed parallel beta-helix repeat-containing protein [Gemmataceae bacterium]|nr:right-handed parallel beta-helix repeat-containing protein [Gemmataceae bacterium]